MPRFIFFVRIGPFVRREFNGSNRDNFIQTSVGPCSKKTWLVTFQRDAANTLARKGRLRLVSNKREYKLKFYNV
jgi:hypothetical protein